MRIILILSALALVFTLALGFGVHGVKGMDDLVEKISRDVRGLTGALSDAIAASKRGRAAPPKDHP
jgi:hypothetical protein